MSLLARCVKAFFQPSSELETRTRNRDTSSKSQAEPQSLEAFFKNLEPEQQHRDKPLTPEKPSERKTGTPEIFLLMHLFLMGCFPVDLQEVKRPLRPSGPSRAWCRAGWHFSRLLNGRFSGTPAMAENGPSKRPTKRSMTPEISHAQTASEPNRGHRLFGGS